MARAFQTSCQTGSLTPLIKEELKYTIMNRRHSAGQEEIVVQFPTPARYELNDEETKRRQVRLEKNRAAAARHREKKKANKRQDEEELGVLEARNTELRQAVEFLETEIRTLRSLLPPAPE
ncbi:cyclic AMP-dependent transcription factor ATF-5-like [Pomacea canaliculata]|uniref:cyclic AMP-dependent transcription factor ATF-5-like n=1 Tax=Pomacea canaliculata TaxID=400727 RepID=UPI000D72FE60|nr:cyclic AMP-dependent transcription factor ATF-5-like [Pomacea canaliculata]